MYDDHITSHQDPRNAAYKDIDSFAYRKAADGPGAAAGAGGGSDDAKVGVSALAAGAADAKVIDLNVQHDMDGMILRVADISATCARAITCWVVAV